MGVFDLFRKAAAKPGGRVCIIHAPREAVYDAMTKHVAEAAALDEDSIARIKDALSPLAKMSGGKVDDILKGIEVHVDKSQRPSELVVETRMAGAGMGPSSRVTFEAVSPTSTRVTLRADIQDSNAGMMDRMLMAGAKKQMAGGLSQGVDQLLQAAANELKAKIEFENTQSS